MAFNKRVVTFLFVFSSTAIISSFFSVNAKADTILYNTSSSLNNSEMANGECIYQQIKTGTTTEKITGLSVLFSGYSYQPSFNAYIKIGIATTTNCTVSTHIETSPEFATSSIITVPGCSGNCAKTWYSASTTYNVATNTTYWVKFCQLSSSTGAVAYYRNTSVDFYPNLSFIGQAWTCTPVIYDFGNLKVYGSDLPPPTCTSWTYSEWTICNTSSTQTRTIASSSPPGCTDGSPVLSQSCTYSPPLVYATTTYNIDGDMTKIGTTFLSFVTRLYQSYWPFILAFSIVSGFGFAIARIFKKLS